MQWRLKLRWGWVMPPFCLIATLAGATTPAEGAATAPTTTAPAAPPAKPATEMPTLDNWMTYLESPVAPSRSQIYKSDDGNAAVLKQETPQPATPIAISMAPAGSRPPLALKPKPGSNDDQLAAIAIEDRDFFQTLAKNPNTWPEAERDRRAQLLHDKYWLYIAEYPDDVNAIVLYGKLLNRTGQRDAAFAAFQHADSLNPKIAVVKQQLANHEAEDGHYAVALDLFRSAVALAPNEPVYHYETAELLDFFYEGFLKDKIFDLAGLNKTMETEFARAMTLAPKTPAFAWRHAECFYDMYSPDWTAALASWEGLAGTMKDPLEVEVIRLHLVRVMIELARFDDARKLLAEPVRDSLDPIRAALGRRLSAAEAQKAAPPASSAPAVSAPKPAS